MVVFFWYVCFLDHCEKLMTKLRILVAVKEDGQKSLREKHTILFYRIKIMDSVCSIRITVGFKIYRYSSVKFCVVLNIYKFLAKHVFYPL